MALVVVTGGARSGKSGAAQRLATARALDGATVSVAVFGRVEIAPGTTDPEFLDRVSCHRSTRPETWTTVEARDSRSWIGEVVDADLLVLDCLGTWMGRVMEEAYDSCMGGGLGTADAGALPAGFTEECTARTEPVLDWLLARQADTIVVTNEVGEGVVPAYASGRFFRDELARANRRLVGAADAAYLALCGRMLDLSLLPPELAWPVD